MADGNVPLVYLDTSVWLQSINGDHPHDLSDRVILAAAAGRVRLVASWLVRAEVQSVASSRIDPAVIAAVDELLDSDGVRWVAVDRFVALKAREVSRALPRRLRGADAVHLATAVLEGADYFMAIDKDFPADLKVDGVPVTRPRVVWAEDLFETVGETG